MAITMKLACVLFVCMMVSAPYTEAAVSCGYVISTLTPCIPYLRGGGPPSRPCCGGVKALIGAARTTPDRQQICGCLKQAASAIGGDGNNAASLPGKCGVSIPYKISPNIDCSNSRNCIK
ncbi:hypothetical protein ACHQM5_020644 [Ranunculus cassubicifolius]